MPSDVDVGVSARVYDRQVGGNTRYTREIYSRLDTLGVSATFLRPPASLPTDRGRSGVYAFLESTYWPLTLSKARVDVIHYPADTGPALRGKLPIVTTIHGMATLHVSGVRSPISDAIWRSRVRKAARISDVIVTVSESSARDIEAFEPKAMDRVVVIPHGIDHQKFNTGPDTNSEQILSRLSLPSRFFLYVGNLDPRKNVDELMTAAASVFDTTGIPLVISGHPAWSSSDILARAQNARAVLYVGRASDEEIVAMMQHTVAFCFPSLYEGFGFPVLEAMACGAPVICSKRGSLESVAGGAAFTLDELDARSIAAAMIEVARDDSMRSSLRRLGLARASQFTWDASARQHADVFRWIAA